MNLEFLNEEDGFLLGTSRFMFVPIILFLCLFLDNFLTHKGAGAFW